MKIINHLLVILLIISLSGCVSILYPRKQKVTINTQNKDSKVYVNNYEVGKGKTVSTRVRKRGPSQIIVITPNSKNNYYVLLPIRRALGYYPLYLCNITNLYGFILDPFVPYGLSFVKGNNMPSAALYPKKTTNEKYINLEAIKLVVANKNKDLSDIELNYSKDLMKAIEKSEKNKNAKDIKKEKRDLKKNKGKKLENLDKIEYDDTKFSENIIKTIKKMGYVDTINKVFTDNNNTLLLQGIIRKANTYTIIGKNFTRFYKSKINVVWYMKNTYGEILDSISTADYSGDFCIPMEEINIKESYSNMFYKMYSDAVDNSFLNLQKNVTYKKNLTINTEQNSSSPLLTISQPTKWVQEIPDATYSSVIIKRKDGGHGSGFAISNDGYLITNYHVIAGKTLDEFEKLTAILSNGEEVPVKVVKYNRSKDVSLLKIDRTFEKPFKLSNTKSYKNLLEVYTIGAPKSIELGQTVTLGLISNERKINNIELLQLSMSLNSGNSGGPLLDKNGNLHGVIVSKLAGFSTEGIGFAIPAYLLFDYLNITYK